MDVIDLVSKVYIIESERRWIKALRATFEPYKEKCVIIQKLVTDYDGCNCVTLEHLLKYELTCPVFVKMDIEGYEKRVIGASKDFLLQQKNIKLACCTYHTILKMMLKRWRICLGEWVINMSFLMDGRCLFYMKTLC